MKEIIAKVEEFLANEYDLNKANYLFESKEDWEKLLAVFREEFLTDNTKGIWAKIPVEHLSPERKAEMEAKLSHRKKYVIKWIKKDDIVNVFVSLPIASDDLVNCLVFKADNNEIKLLSIETVCDTCFGAGYIDQNRIKCSRCSGKGFNYSKTSGLVNWRTVFAQPEEAAESLTIRLPSSELQKEVVAIQ